MENSHQRNHSTTTYQLVTMSLLSALSLILMFLAIPIIPIAPYMKLDFSDLPILIGAAAFGPGAGLIIAGLKSLLYWFMTGASIPGLIGIFSSFVASAMLIFGFALLRDRFKKSQFLNHVLTIVAMTGLLTVVMALMNWSFVIPLYMNLIGMKIGMPLNSLILLAVIPFNLIKGIVIGGLFIFILIKIVPRLKIKGDQ